VTFVEGTVIFADGAVTSIGGAVTFIGGAVTFVGKGSSAVGRSFKIAEVGLYCCWAGCGGLYKLGCRGSLALVKGEGEASGACADGACVGGACADKAACWGTDDIKGVNECDLRR
jgi:hypothetical protein